MRPESGFLSRSALSPLRPLRSVRYALTVEATSEAELKIESPSGVRDARRSMPRRIASVAMSWSSVAPRALSWSFSPMMNGTTLTRAPWAGTSTGNRSEMPATSSRTSSTFTMTPSTTSRRAATSSLQTRSSEFKATTLAADLTASDRRSKTSFCSACSIAVTAAGAGSTCMGWALRDASASASASTSSSAGAAARRARFAGDFGVARRSSRTPPRRSMSSRKSA
mmetsp:Transcript_8802/g.30304  ORF Transcript_8802/g.30304 Transcript_8802/m.30304 type:complete len:225 (-) Transcript_8802:428-1102(-)